jgi:hypothetical protein
MPTCSIRVCPKDQTETAFPELTRENTLSIDAELYGVSILEAGMQSGKTSIGIVLQMPDGKFVLAQTSAAILSMLYHALVGAEQRFEENKK